MEGETYLCRGLDQTLYIEALFEDHIASEYKICAKPVVTARQYRKTELGNCLTARVLTTIMVR